MKRYNKLNLEHKTNENESFQFGKRTYNDITYWQDNSLLETLI